MEVDPTPFASSSRRTIQIQENSFDATPQTAFSYNKVKNNDPVICIDNGSHSWRAGFSSMSSPYIDRTNVISRYKERKQARNTLLFGQDADADANSRSNQRLMYDGDLLIHGDLLECALDFTFSTLGINTSKLEHPVVMTEKLASPLFTRAMTSELLFELYQAPAVTYGVDSLFAFSRRKHQDGLVFNLGHNTTTLIPVVNGQSIITKAKRIPWGGSQASDSLLRLAQLKYPRFPVKVTPPQASFMFKECCFFASDYPKSLAALADPQVMTEATVSFQFPFTQADVVEKTEAEKAALAERQRENGRRLQEISQANRAQKLAAKIAELEEYKELLALKAEAGGGQLTKQELKDTPFRTQAEMESWIKEAETNIRRKQQRDAGEQVEVEDEPVFPLLDKPDEELDEDELREKKKQRLMKGAWEARVKIREEKEKEKERLDAIRRKEEEDREADPVGWASRLRAEQDAVIARMTEREKRKSELGNRKSAAAQSRMKIVANLAAEESTSKKRKKADEKDDGFGRDDSDWAVYREVGGDDDIDEEEEDRVLLESIESKLLKYDPTFGDFDTKSGRAHARNGLLNSFQLGDPTTWYDETNTAALHRLHLNVERIRVPETWFQPSIFGIDSAGLGELTEWVMRGYDEDVKRRMMECIFVTGGSANIPNFQTRLRNALTPILPWRVPMKIVSSLDGGDPRLEAWKGMAEWSVSEEAKGARVTRAEYEEHGGEWLKEHRWGNLSPLSGRDI